MCKIEYVLIKSYFVRYECWMIYLYIFIHVSWKYVMQFFFLCQRIILYEIDIIICGYDVVASPTP